MLKCSANSSQRSIYQPTASKFHLTGSKNIVANYKLLQPLLDEYRIEYDNELLRNIIMEERGAALKLLFQLR